MSKKDNIIFQDTDSKVIRKKISIIILILVLFALIFAFFTGDRNIRHYLELKQQITQLENDIEQLETENKNLEKMIKLINEDPYYIEKIAREELKKAGKDEKIIEFQNEEELKVESDPDTD